MMAWSSDHQHHHASRAWRVSALIAAFLELIFVFLIFICAIISITTTRLLKSSGLFRHQTCLSCDVHDHHHHHHHHRQGGNKHVDHVEGNPKLDATAMNVICEDCTPCLSNCECIVKRGYLIDKTAPGMCRCRCNSASVNGNNPLNCTGDHTVWRNDYACRNRCGGSCGLFANVDYSCDATSEHIVFDSTPTITAYGCERRRCVEIGGHSPPYSRSRPLKRKYAKVFHNDSREDRSSPCCGHPNVGFGGRGSLIMSGIGEGPPEENQMNAEDVSSSRVLSDASGDAGHHYPGRLFPEDSVRLSSQESFSYTDTHSSPKFSLYGAATEMSESTVKLSIDTDLLAGECTPEWCGSSASPAALAGKEMEEAGSRMHEEDTVMDVSELREALREEQEAIAALYLELEEERNAASSAAHEAMAMITRLQEEKAAIRMEARQYQRMTEEKQQYDQESMAMLREILVKKDQEVYALEEELNLCRKRLLTLGMDEPMDHNGGGTDRIGRSPKRANDMLLIERETLLLEGSEDWKNRRDRRDDKLLAEIKNWLHEANEKVAPDRIDEFNVPGNRLLLGNGKKNLLESFSSVAVEESQREEIANEGFQAHLDGIANEKLESQKDSGSEEFEVHGIVNEELEIHNETAAGYESFQGMMESLRQEPSLRDEESLKTLKKIEEKFHRHSSSKGEVRTGDELRQIWKNILKSFESDERMDAEVCGEEIAEAKEQSPIIAVEPAGAGDNPDQREFGNAVDTDRSIGEKRLSVLEYVSKFEEQLHQLGNKNPPHAGKLALSIVDSVAEAPPEPKGASLEAAEADKKRKTSLSAERPIPTRTRFRKLLSADGRNAVPDVERNRFGVRGEASLSSERATRIEDPRFEEESNQDGSSVVHDIYEVPEDAREPLTNIASQRRIDVPVAHEIKKYISSSVNDLVPGHCIDSHETARCVELYLSETGEPEIIAGHTLEERSANGKGRPEQKIENASRNFSLSVKDQLPDLWPGIMSGESDGCALKSPSSLVTNSSEIVMQDVIQQLTRKLKALETDRQVMQDTIASLKREDGETKHLQDIAKQLPELRGLEQTAVTNKDTWLSDDPALLSSIKGMVSLDGLRRTVLSQLTKVGQIFRGNGNPGGYQEYQPAGLFRLLHKSPPFKQHKPIERARSLKAVYAANKSPSDAQSQPSTSTLDSLLSRTQSWPMDVKDRSETAFGGWDC